MYAYGFSVFTWLLLFFGIFIPYAWGGYPGRGVTLTSIYLVVTSILFFPIFFIECVISDYLEVAYGYNAITEQMTVWGGTQWKTLNLSHEAIGIIALFILSWGLTLPIWYALKRLKLVKS